MSTKPKIYCASKLYRASMWREWKRTHASIVTVVSTWHESETVEQDDASSNEACRKGWIANLDDLRSANYVLAYCVESDKPNGTLTEIGGALYANKRVLLVGQFAWGTWRHLPLVTQAQSLEHALAMIVKDHSHDKAQ